MAFELPSLGNMAYENLSANPLEDINNTRQIEGVMARGNWLPQSKIQEMLAALPASYETTGDPRE